MKKYLGLVISVVAGLIVFGISMNAAYHEGITVSNIYGDRGYTIEHLEEAKHQIQDYQDEHGKLPSALEDAYSDTLNRDIEDAYGHPLIYKISGSHFEIISYGLDQRPGGTGENTDISSDNTTLVNKLLGEATIAKTTGNLAETAMTIKEAKSQVDAYFNQYHKLPTTLRDTSPDPDLRELQDAFGRKLIYVPRGSTYTLMSYGRDGKPGGTGLDADISIDNLHPPQGRMTFKEFLHDSEDQDMISATFITGLATAALTFFMMRKENWASRSWAATAFKMIITLVLTTYVSVIITVMHEPSGH